MDQVIPLFQNGLAYIQAHPLLILLFLWVANVVYQRNQSFPTVDYGCVDGIRSEAELSKVKTAGHISVVDYYATWCPPCRQAVPVYARMSDEYASKGVKFYKIDVDEVHSVASVEGVSAMPTFKVYREGACVGSVRGFNQQELVRVIDEILLGTSKAH